jgi:hypothetical protein
MATGGSPIIALLASIAEKDMEMDKILFETNMNVRVMVQLTKNGKTMFRQEISTTNELVRSNYPDRKHLLLDPDDELKEMEDKHDGWCLFPLWELMRIFGPLFGTGKQGPFKGGIVRFVE